MSDFDKEAEREKLRKKYGEDQEKREVAEKMSELLLQGATMTNAHCSQCGDPIFRYDGQEFCATCEQAVDRDGDEGADESDDADQEIEVTSPSEDAQVKFGSDDAKQTEDDQSPTQQTSAQPNQQQEAAGQQPAGQPAQSRRETTDQQSAGQPASRQESTGQQPPNSQAAQENSGSTPRQRRDAASNARRQPERTHEVPSVTPSENDDVSAARASLVRTLTRFSEQAEATDDPQRAREHLAAAREAAEALSTLRQ